MERVAILPAVRVKEKLRSTGLPGKFPVTVAVATRVPLFSMVRRRLVFGWKSRVVSAIHLRMAGCPMWSLFSS